MILSPQDRLGFMSIFPHLLPAGWIGASVSRFVFALVATIAFTILARLLRGVSRSGAIAGSLICWLFFASAGVAGFAALASVFVLAWTSTRLGYGRKQRLGTAEKSDGRSCSQVLANLAVGAVCALLYAMRAEPLFLLAAAASLAEAAADTVSSEFGQAHSTSARLITSWQLVPAGTNGGVTLPGSLAGAAAAVVVGLVCLIGGLISRQGFWIATLAGLVGMFADSFLGALLEGRSLSNDAVNFLGTLSAAVTATIAAHLVTMF
jgi:uncharacterized protein (TIGR00297 family)